MTNPSSAIEHPIYPLIADFLTWLAPLVEKFPRSQRPYWAIVYSTRPTGANAT